MDSDVEQSQVLVTAAAIVLGLAILAIFVVGVFLIWWVSRRARQLLKRRGPTHTVMPDLWFQNRPDKPERGDT